MDFSKRYLTLTAVAIALLAGRSGWAQQTAPAGTTPDAAQAPAAPAPAADAPATPAPDAVPAPAAEAMPAATPDATAAAAPATPTDQAAPVVVAPAPAAGGVKQGYVKVGKKEEWVGSNEIIVLAPTPMLDEEGKQRLDPDAKPMFNPGVKQERDKHGHPFFDEKGKPVFQTAKDLGYDEDGKKIHEEKVKPPKLTPVSISGGTYTVDGVIGKAALNYEIADLKYIYLYSPGLGITVVSNEMFPGAKEQPNAFDGKTLTVTIGEHQLQIGSEKKLLQSKTPVSAFVLVDRDFTLPSKYPVVGYGTLRKPPYAWPGSKAQVVRTGAFVAPPPPANLRPVLLMQPCPAGQMRKPAPMALPGEVAPEQPCIPIPKGASTLAAPKKVTPAAVPVVAPAPAAPTPAAPAPAVTAPAATAATAAAPQSK